MGNGEKPKEQRKKKCPFLNEWCIQDACTLWVQLTQVVGGMQKQMGMCALTAFIVVLSEISNKTQPPVQQMKIPRLFKG